MFIPNNHRVRTVERVLGSVESIGWWNVRIDSLWVMHGWRVQCGRLVLHLPLFLSVRVFAVSRAVSGGWVRRSAS